MSKVPSLNYDKVIHALRRDGWIVVRQKGSHIRMQKATMDETLKITIPAHKPIKRSTLSQNSGLFPNNFDKRSAITGLSERCSLDHS
jgi:predicted RNA binding protein YcfA (HicA-like mRNA interferase family)